MRRRREEPAAALARRYGVSENTLYKWREQFRGGGRLTKPPFLVTDNGASFLAKSCNAPVRDV